MKNKTQSKIMEILNEFGGLTSYQIDKKMKGRGYTITSDTLDKNLKIMAEKGELTRRAEGKPWRYYYNLNIGGNRSQR